jgi:hypothetical protein
MTTGGESLLATEQKREKTDGKECHVTTKMSRKIIKLIKNTHHVQLPSGRTRREKDERGG